METRPARPATAVERGRSSRRWIYVVAVVAVAAAVMMMDTSSKDLAGPRPDAALVARPATPTLELPAAGRVVHREGHKVAARIVPLPGILPEDYVPREHDYGASETFIRQPQDYRGTPRKLGDKNGYALYDLERVQDMVRRGMEPNSEFARLDRGPLTEQERGAARAALQQFFDEGTMVVDAVLDGVISPDDAYRRFFRERRQRLNRELRQTLHLGEDDFYTLWPQIRVFAEHLEQIDAIADLPQKS